MKGEGGRALPVPNSSSRYTIFCSVIYNSVLLTMFCSALITYINPLAPAVSILLLEHYFDSRMLKQIIQYFSLLFCTTEILFQLVH